MDNKMMGDGVSDAIGHYKRIFAVLIEDDVQVNDTLIVENKRGKIDARMVEMIIEKGIREDSGLPYTLCLVENGGRSRL